MKLLCASTREPTDARGRILVTSALTCPAYCNGCPSVVVVLCCAPGFYVDFCAREHTVPRTKNAAHYVLARRQNAADRSKRRCDAVCRYIVSERGWDAGTLWCRKLLLLSVIWCYYFRKLRLLLIGVGGCMDPYFTSTVTTFTTKRLKPNQ